MQSQSLHITPSPRQYSTPPRALSFMGSERILNMPLRTIPAPVPIRHPPKLDDDETEDGEDVDMEDSDDRGDAITINTTSSDGEYMKQDSHQTVVSETESDGVGDYYTPREEPSPCIHAADTILPDADTTFRAPVPRLSTLEHTILLLLQSAQRSCDPYHQARGVHVTAIVRAVKRKIEHPEDMSAALDNLMDRGLITTTIDALHYKAGRLPDHQLSPMLLV
ncbi:hypothetical protein BD410DRAFT_294005 [Rickenella mellea]|uniref:Uncharacterized protein n=1 Tax=Rickenella mellea TaxID=50990 RepID=A0A4Y7Q2J2_9AGAM|nr:hypothetical protein BD410DRAFT_294005 [Rickenella mellea]